MTIEQLEFFVAVDKYRSFSVAAEECYVSQSSLSKQIKSLEQEIGVSLIDRKTRKLELTRAGQDFMSYAEAAIREYRKIMQQIRKYAEHNEYIINIGMIPVMNQYGLMDIFYHFQNQYPHIRLKMTENNSLPILELWEKGEFDMVFLRSNNLPESDCDVFSLYDDELVLVTDCTNPLAKANSIDLKKAENEEFLFLSDATGMYKSCVAACKKAGFVPRARALDLRSSTIKNLVANGQGVSLMMLQSVCDLRDDRIKIIRLKEPPKISLSLAVRSGILQNDYINTFIEYVRDSFGVLDEKS